LLAAVLIVPLGCKTMPTPSNVSTQVMSQIAPANAKELLILILVSLEGKGALPDPSGISTRDVSRSYTEFGAHLARELGAVGIAAKAVVSFEPNPNIDVALSNSHVVMLTLKSLSSSPQIGNSGRTWQLTILQANRPPQVGHTPLITTSFTSDFPKCYSRDGRIAESERQECQAQMVTFVQNQLRRSGVLK